MKRFLKLVTDKIQDLQEIREKYKSKPEKTSVPTKKNTSTAENRQVIEVEIRAITVIKVLLIVVLVMALGRVFVEMKTLLITAVIAFFLAMGLSPVLDGIERRRVPRPLAILILYVLFFGALTLLFVKIIPIIGEQLSQIASDIRRFLGQDLSKVPVLDQILQYTQFDAAELQQFVANNLTSISRNLQSVAGSTFGILTSLFRGVFNLIFALVLLFFILMEREQIGRFFLLLFPHKDRGYIREKAQVVQGKMGQWFRGQMILMVSIGLFMYVGMKIFEFAFGMKYAATIGLLAGFMELVPYLGVLLTGVLSGLIALNISWVLLIVVIAWIALAQFLEGNLLVPMVMEKVTGLSSVVTILALSTGGVLGYAAGGVALSILGMIFSIPIAASVAIFVEEYTQRKK